MATLEAAWWWAYAGSALRDYFARAQQKYLIIKSESYIFEKRSVSTLNTSDQLINGLFYFVFKINIRSIVKNTENSKKIE
jgi:hypothetical protein